MTSIEGLPFSYEQRDFWKSAARNPGEALDMSIPRGQENEYLIDTIDQFEPTELFRQLSSVANELDTVYGEEYRMGESFMDGAVIAGDAITRYAPYLMKPVEQNIKSHINEQFEKAYPHLRTDGFYTDAQQYSYVEYFLQPQRVFAPVFSPDFNKVVKRVAAEKYGQKYQRDVMKTSFEFVMIHAEIAYKDDVKALNQAEQSAKVGHAIIGAGALDAELQALLANKEQYF